MSIEIGYNYWENGKIVSCDDAWMNGRNDLGEMWGRYFTSKYDPDTGRTVYYTPVFNQELDGMILYDTEGDSVVEMGYYVELNQFLDDMQTAINDAEDEESELKLQLVRAIKLDHQRIADLRDEQRKCSDEDAYAFRKWGEEVDELYESITDRQRALDDVSVLVEEYHSQYWVINSMRALLERMQKDIKAGKTVVPFCSY